LNRVIFRDADNRILGERDMPTVPNSGDYIDGIDGLFGQVHYRRYHFDDRDWTVVLYEM
jgi:hypothetical protein